MNCPVCGSTSVATTMVTEWFPFLGEPRAYEATFPKMTCAKCSHVRFDWQRNHAIEKAKQEIRGDEPLEEEEPILYSRPNWSPEYAAYHAQVVDACAKLMGENQRQFFEEQCDYFDAFERNQDPDEVAWAEWEALT